MTDGLDDFSKTRFFLNCVDSLHLKKNRLRLATNVLTLIKITPFKLETVISQNFSLS